MTEFVEAIFAQLIGNIATLLLVVLIYFNFLLFETYWRLIIWAILFSQALRQAKSNVISVLRFLSDDPSVAQQGFVTSALTKSFEVLLYQPHDGGTRKNRRAAKEILLNYGIFLFSLIGAVSIWLRMYSWMSFLHFCVGFALVSLCALKFLNQRLFYYRYFISDEVLVSTVLVIGFFITGIFVLGFLGSECYREGSRAAMDVSEWVQDNFVNDEKTRQVWHEQVNFGREMFSSALGSFETNYNDTMWWPPLKSLVKTYYLDALPHVGNDSANATLEEPGVSVFPTNMTLLEAMTFAYSKVDSVNLVQWRGWTLKGLEVSSLAFGSLSQLLLLIVTFLVAFVSLGIRAFFFVSSLFYLLCTKWDPIERFVEDLLPIQPQTRPVVVRSIRRVIGGVVFLPLKMSSLHAIITLVSLSIVDADFVYLGTTFTFIISIVPIIPPYLVCLPWVVATWNTSFLRAVVLFAVHYVGFSVLDDALYEKSIFALNSYVSALSVVFGVYVFGIEGVIFGPLVVCGVYFAYEASNHGIQAAQDEFARHADDSQAQLELSGDEVDKPVSPRGHDHALSPDTNNASVSPTAKSPGSPPLSPSHRRESNIFSDAYRVFSGKNRSFVFPQFADRVKRRLSIDCSSNDAVCVTIVPEQGNADKRRLRFAVDKTWSQKTFLDSLKQFLHVQQIEGVFTPDGAEILSPLHVFPHETLHVRIRTKRQTMESPTNSCSSGPFSAPLATTKTTASLTLNAPTSLPMDCSSSAATGTGLRRLSGKTPSAKRRPRLRASSHTLLRSMTPRGPPGGASFWFAKELSQALDQAHKDKRMKISRDDSSCFVTTGLAHVQVSSSRQIVERKRSSSLNSMAETAKQLEKYQLEFQRRRNTTTDEEALVKALTLDGTSSAQSTPSSPGCLKTTALALPSKPALKEEKSEDSSLAQRRKFLFSPLLLAAESSADSTPKAFFDLYAPEHQQEPEQAQEGDREEQLADQAAAISLNKAEEAEEEGIALREDYFDGTGTTATTTTTTPLVLQPAEQDLGVKSSADETTTTATLVPVKKQQLSPWKALLGL